MSAWSSCSLEGHLCHMGRESWFKLSLQKKAEKGKKKKPLMTLFESLDPTIPEASNNLGLLK